VEEEEEDRKGALLESTSNPVMVLYDEIDSHVGGRAAVAVAKLLSTQGTVGNQIISITHSAAIASIANKHLVVEKTQDASIVKGGGVNVRVAVVRGGKREEEIARMAGGEMVGEVEGVEFAKALLSEGEKQRDASVTG
jgi:DNA repair protein RecN (Recombination protein N)